MTQGSTLAVAPAPAKAPADGVAGVRAAAVERSPGGRQRRAEGPGFGRMLQEALTGDGAALPADPGAPPEPQARGDGQDPDSSADQPSRDPAALLLAALGLLPAAAGAVPAPAGTGEDAAAPGVALPPQGVGAVEAVGPAGAGRTGALWAFGERAAAAAPGGQAPSLTAEIPPDGPGPEPADEGGPAARASGPRPPAGAADAALPGRPGGAVAFAVRTETAAGAFSPAARAAGERPDGAFAGGLDAAPSGGSQPAVPHQGAGAPGSQAAESLPSRFFMTGEEARADGLRATAGPQLRSSFLGAGPDSAPGAASSRRVSARAGERRVQPPAPEPDGAAGGPSGAPSAGAGQQPGAEAAAAPDGPPSPAAAADLLGAGAAGSSRATHPALRPHAEGDRADGAVLGSRPHAQVTVKEGTEQAGGLPPQSEQSPPDDQALADGGGMGRAERQGAGDPGTSGVAPTSVARQGGPDPGSPGPSQRSQGKPRAGAAHKPSTAAEPSGVAAAAAAPDGAGTPGPERLSEASRLVAAEVRRWLEAAGSAQRPEARLQVVDTRLADGGGEVRLRLHPPELGEIRLRLQTEGARLVVQAAVQHQETGQLLRQHSHLLQQALEQAGLQLAGFSVEVGQGWAGGQHPGPAAWAAYGPLHGFVPEGRPTGSDTSGLAAERPLWVRLGLGAVDVTV